MEKSTETTRGYSKAILLITLAVLIQIISGCSGRITSGEQGGKVQRPDCEAADSIEGWCSEDAYRVRVTEIHSGVNMSGLKHEAVKEAQKRILERFIELGIDVNHTEFDPVAYQIADEVRDAVKNGKVISEKYDGNSCEIIYEVNSKRLRKKVINSAFE